ncbi:MAG: OmpA family protein [Candidatus Muiribacteriota bacterium]
MKKSLIFLFLIFSLNFIFCDEKNPLIIGMIENSNLYYQEITEHGEYKIPLSSLDEGEFKKIQTVNGKIVRTIFTHEKESSFSIYNSYVNQLTKQGFEILLQIEKDSGGVNFKKIVYALNPVENDRNFERSIPFNSGSDTNQYYISAIKKMADRDIYVTININTGWWNYPVYRVDIIETEVEIPEIKDVEQIASKLLQKGRVEFFNILFESDNENVTSTSVNTLKLLGEYIIKNQHKEFYIVGHTDNTYDFDKSMDISIKRAQSVLNFLKNNFELSDIKISAHGLGQLCPIFSNHTKQGRKFNERVELVVK